MGISSLSPQVSRRFATFRIGYKLNRGPTKILPSPTIVYPSLATGSRDVFAWMCGRFDSFSTFQSGCCGRVCVNPTFRYVNDVSVGCRPLDVPTWVRTVAIVVPQCYARRLDVKLTL